MKNLSHRLSSWRKYLWTWMLPQEAVSQFSRNLIQMNLQRQKWIQLVHLRPMENHMQQQPLKCFVGQTETQLNLLQSKQRIPTWGRKKMKCERGLVGEKAVAHLPSWTRSQRSPSWIGTIPPSFSFFYFFIRPWFACWT